MSNVSNMSRGQLRLFIEKVLLNNDGTVFYTDTVLSHDGYIEGILKVEDSATVEVSDGKTVTILDTHPIL
mgnify:FL=1